MMPPGLTGIRGKRVYDEWIGAGGARLSRPARAGGASSKVIAAKEWIWVDAAHPGTVQTKNSTLKMQSKVNATYSSGDVATGQLAIINFGKKISVPASLVEYANFLIGTPSASNTPNGTMNLTGTVTSAVTPTGIMVMLKITPITKSFSVAALDWSNVVTIPSLTYGPAVYSDGIMIGAQFGPSVNDQPSSVVAAPWSGVVSNMEAEFTIPVGGFYGLQLEVKPYTEISTGLAIGSLSVSFVTADYTVNLKHPTLILPAS